MKLIDLTGQRFGKLVVIQRHIDPSKKYTLWECKCDCGNEAIVRANRLMHGRTQSCGCLRAESNYKKKTTHGQSGTNLYAVWNSMKGRCYNRNNINYKRYGGRGITVCDEWRYSFESFLAWSVSTGYVDGLTLDRIDNNGIYSPDNCRWVTTAVQNNNRNVSINITYNGKTQNLSEWCKELHLPYLRVWQRITKYGFTFEEAISEPCHKRSGKKKTQEVKQ